MLLTTDVPTADERQRVLAELPWLPDFMQLWRFVSEVFDHTNISVLDATIPYGHARGAIVALSEGVDTMLDATYGLADSCALMSLLDRDEVPRPTMREPLSAAGADSKTPRSLCLRLARSSLENSAVRVASAADHLANAHVRLAWELNAATSPEVEEFFDPRKQNPGRWLSAKELADKLVELDIGEGARLPFFTSNEAFRAYYSNPDAARMRRFRDGVVHRERPTYRELPSLGRETQWRDGSIRLGFVPDPKAPNFDQRQAEVSGALRALLPWAQSLWDTAVSWLQTMQVGVVEEDGQLDLHIVMELGSQPVRDKRDPAPYLLDRAPFARPGRT